ncbi:unnamed protein product [Adineta ricciae]|uniref:Mono(ADP-ribosyl)transferase n=1 Tax=Adineta ricciae TaxID=249248 RepID=A0A815FR21_ADIRI|nr:unnamed protein product [Adineta ricciae]CAF1529754.1 unnamed protein product [Adineta ricciae]
MAQQTNNINFNRFINEQVCELRDANHSPIYGYQHLPILTLEQSVEKVLPIVPGLEYYITQAKEHCRKSSTDLTLDQSAAIYLYTMPISFFSKLNEDLRAKDRHALKPWFPFLKLFLTAVEKLSSLQITIWRGVNADATSSFLCDGEEIWWSINSCSKNTDIVGKYIGPKGTLFAISALEAKDISRYSAIPDEEEVILMPGTHLSVRYLPLNFEDRLLILHLHEEPKPREKEICSVSSQIESRIKSGNKFGGLEGGHSFDDFIENGLTSSHYLCGMITGCNKYPLDWCQFCYSSLNDDKKLIIKSELQGTYGSDEIIERFCIKKNERINKVQVIVDYITLYVDEVRKLVPLVRGIRLFTTNGRSSGSIDHLNGELYTEEIPGYFVGYVMGRSGAFIDQLQFHWYKN